MTLVINFAEDQMNLFGAVIGMVASAGCKFEVLNNQSTKKSVPEVNKPEVNKPVKVAEPKTFKAPVDTKVYFVKEAIKDGRKIVARKITVNVKTVDKDGNEKLAYCHPKDVRTVANKVLKDNGFVWDGEQRIWTGDEKTFKNFTLSEYLVTAQAAEAVREMWRNKEAKRGNKRA